MRAVSKEEICKAYLAAHSGEDLPDIIDHKILSILLQRGTIAGSAYRDDTAHHLQTEYRVLANYKEFIVRFRAYVHYYLSFFYNYYWNEEGYVALAAKPLTDFSLSAFEALKAQYKPEEIMQCIADFPTALAIFFKGAGKASVIGEYFVNCSESKSRITRYLKAKEFLAQRESALQERLKYAKTEEDKFQVEIESRRLKKQWPFAKNWSGAEIIDANKLSSHLVTKFFPALNRHFDKLQREWYEIRYKLVSANDDIEVAYFLDRTIVQLAEDKKQLIGIHSHVAMESIATQTGPRKFARRD